LFDLEQVTKMRFLRIKVDVATQGLTEARRNTVREHLRDLYCNTIPIQRLWLYLKTQRDIALQSAETYSLYPETFGDGPEDVLVKAKDIVRPECLPLLLHFAVLLGLQHRAHPNLTPSSSFDLNAAGAERLRTIHSLAFSPGSFSPPPPSSSFLHYTKTKTKDTSSRQSL
jgi:hypothetical protein